LNYFIFKLSKEDKADYPSLAYSSILIKFKYYILKKELGMLDSGLIDYGKKIYENLHQLGGCSKNKYLNSCIKEVLDYKGSSVAKESIKETKQVTQEPVRTVQPVEQPTQQPARQEKVRGLDKL
jgi:hypothetical protein